MTESQAKLVLGVSKKGGWYVGDDGTVPLVLPRYQHNQVAPVKRDGGRLLPGVRWVIHT